MTLTSYEKHIVQKSSIVDSRGPCVAIKKYGVGICIHEAFIYPCLEFIFTVLSLYVLISEYLQNSFLFTNLFKY
jgi:hypothetical protein